MAQEIIRAAREAADPPVLTKVKLHEPTFGEDEIQAVVDVLRSTMVTSGDKVREFESYFGPNAVMCNSGSSANLLAIAALCNPLTDKRLHPGDEVIVSALSWSTTVWPLVQHGLIPVIVDIDPDTLNIDVNQVHRAIGPRTRAVMPVHVYGNPCDMSALMIICSDNELDLIEDCCEALGAEYDKKLVGSFGDFATFSFYFSHHITTLEGGLVIAAQSGMAENIRILRGHGWIRDLNSEHSGYCEDHPDIDPKFLFVNMGYNLRCTEVQAAIGLVQLKKIHTFIEARRKAAYLLSIVFGRYLGWLRSQVEIPGSRSSWFGYPVVVRKEAPFSSRELRDWFESKGIETRSIICGNIARQPGMRLFPHRVVGSLTEADMVMECGFSIGCHQDMGEAECHYV
ncbi:hypothetical protein LCGC14_1579920, partial [marine sediment metagenome]